MKKYFLINHKHHSILVIFSSIAYFLSIFHLWEIGINISLFSFFVFLSSTLYHSYPENIFLRIADWLSASFFIYYILENLFPYLDKNILPIIITLFSVGFLSWIISFILLLKKEDNTKIYTLTHTIWHILSGLSLYILILNS